MEEKSLERADLLVNMSYDLVFVCFLSHRKWSFRAPHCLLVNSVLLCAPSEITT